MHAFYESRNNFFESFTVNNMTFTSHLHRQIEILYVLEGNVEVFFNGDSQLLNEGDLFFSFPNTVHGYQSPHSSKVFIIICEHSAIPDFSNLLLQMYAKHPIVTGADLHSEAKYILNYLFNDCPSESNPKLLKGYLLILLCRLIEKLELINRENQPGSEAFYNALNYISNHFREPISQETTAKACGISKYHLSRLFTAKLGYSFNSYLNSLRVEHAKHLLLTTNLPIIEIGYTSGFSSQSSYYRAFRENSLPSPHKIRQKNPLP